MPVKNAFYAQSGGVTAVINATACGLIEAARKHKTRIGKVYAGRDGIIGALTEDLIDTSKESAAAIRALRHTPSGAFGSCRYKLKGLEENRAQYERLIEVFKAHNIGYFFYNGGNDSADTAYKVSQISEKLGKPMHEILANTDLCVNGTTVALNALIQHKGVKTGLICTAGHEDSIEIRNGHKEDGFRYDPEYPAATMLVPRYLRKGVRERVLSDGSVRTPMHEEDVRAACALFKKEGVETVAISFVWSVLNTAHERRAAQIVREMLPNAILTVGSELYPQVREYTRTSTAVVNAYLAPVMRRYVAAVDGYFRSLGAKQPVRYFQSNGGLAIGQAMTDRSVYAINSGPASAPQAGLYAGAPFDHKNVITVDMGGQAKFGPDVEWIHPDGPDTIDYTVDPHRADKFYAAVRKYWPALKNGALQPGYAGIRPKTVPQGAPAQDFVIQGPGEHGVPGLIHMFGIESPGLTASLALAEHVRALASNA